MSEQYIELVHPKAKTALLVADDLLGAEASVMAIRWLKRIRIGVDPESSMHI